MGGDRRVTAGEDGTINVGSWITAGFAALVRAVRRKHGWRQIDLAERARVSQSMVSRIERAECGNIGGDVLDAVAAALRIRLHLDCSFQGARGDALVDSAHAALVEALVQELNALGWSTRVELSFNEYGERGIVDVVGWQEKRLALAVFEVKSDLGDLQETVGRLDIKGRLAPTVVAREFGWRPKFSAVILVVTDCSGARKCLASHAATFAAALPCAHRRCPALARCSLRPAARHLVSPLYAPGDW